VSTPNLRRLGEGQLEELDGVCEGGEGRLTPQPAEKRTGDVPQPTVGVGGGKEMEPWAAFRLDGPD
jgi:hypothetical protein